jgi:hypothetical protein
MTPPISPSDLQRVLKTLPPERPDPFPHLADLNADQLIQRRVEVTGNIKTLEQERHAIDAVLLSTFGDAELRFGVRAPGGWVLEQRSRTSWDYAPEIRDANKGLQQQAQGGQQASRESRYTCTAHAWVVGSSDSQAAIALIR